MSTTRQAQTIEYANARIRGHRANLFTSDDFERFLSLESFSSFLVALGGTKYRKDLENNLALHRDVTAVGYASSDYMLREFRFIDKLLSDKQKVGIRAIGSYWDFSDFKLVLRGVHSGTSREELIKGFRGPGIVISRESLEVLASQESLEDVLSLIQLMRIPFFAEMRELHESHFVPEAFTEFEASLDKAFFATTLKDLEKGSRNELAYKYFIAQINKRNLMTLVRIIRSSIVFEDAEDAQKYFLEGGTLITDVEEFKRFSELDDLDVLAKRLKEHAEGQILKKELAEYYLSSSLSSLDRALDAAMLRAAIQVGKRDFFGNGIALAYLLALEDEVRNLRLIAHGKSFGIDTDDIRKEFILM